MSLNYKSNLYMVTVLFFILGLFNMFFAWLGLACFTLPFIFLFKDRNKTWCKSYCPRASLLTKLTGRVSQSKPVPKWLLTKKFKHYVLIYFGFNLFFAAMSSMMVVMSRIAPIDKIRLFMFFQLPWEVPQILTISGISPWLIHGSFRIYSIMLSSTLIGLLLGYLYKPRTWCAICPVGTLSDRLLADQREKRDDTSDAEF